MATDLENARVTELHVRMDCNGCVQRIKKAIHSIDGVYNVNVDISQQKLTVVGSADPEALIKAIKKTRKTAIISAHCEPEPPSEAAPPAESEPTNDPPPLENSSPEESKPLAEPWNSYPPMIHEAPYYVTRSYNTYRTSPYVTEYGSLRSPPRDARYYNSLETNNDGYYQNSGSEEYHQSRGSDGNHYNSMFSDENPNACIIV